MCIAYIVLCKDFLSKIRNLLVEPTIHSAKFRSGAARIELSKCIKIGVGG
jgi:hypothetical protein